MKFVNPHPSLEHSIIIPTSNRLHTLKDCIKSIRFSSHPLDQTEIIIIDDGVTEGLDDYVETLQQDNVNLRLLRQSSQGPAAARNLGVAHSNGKLIIFTDDDCVVARNWLGNISNAMSDSTIAGLGGKVVSKQKNMINKYMDYIRVLDPALLLDGTPIYLVTANACVRRELFETVGGFDENFSYAGGEDSEFSLRVRQHNLKMIFDPTCVILHNFSNSLIDFLGRFYRYGVGTRMMFEKHGVWEEWIPNADKYFYWSILHIDKDQFRQFVEIDDKTERALFAMLHWLRGLIFLAGYMGLQSLENFFDIMWKEHKMDIAQFFKTSKRTRGKLTVSALETLVKGCVHESDGEAAPLLNDLEHTMEAKDLVPWATIILNNLDFNSIFHALRYNEQFPPGTPTINLSPEELAVWVNRKEERKELYNKKNNDLFAKISHHPSFHDLAYLEEQCHLEGIEFQRFMAWKEKHFKVAAPP